MNKCPKPNVSFCFQPVSVEYVYFKILSLSNSKCLDFYGINSEVLKISAPFICEILCHLFNEGLVENSNFPSTLKNIKVIPIYKKGDKKQINNYRPISIVPVISKVFEAIMQEQISNHFEIFGLFTDKQYGFRPSRNTSGAVVRLVNNVIDDLEKGQSVSFRSYDMSKAFDTVKHSILSSKLYHYGFNSDSVNLILSYLTNRSQFVYKDGQFSFGRKVQYGVPQGSILGPILFNIYINDIICNIEGTHKDGFLFADDFGLKVSCSSRTDVENCLANSSLLLNDWCASNNLSLNLDKISDLHFSYHRHCFNEVDTEPLKFLGIVLDPKLNWQAHVEYVSKKLAKGLYMLRRLKFSVDLKVLLNVYFSQIQSLLCYGILLWGSSTHTCKIFLLQKKAIRIICNVDTRTHCKPLFAKLGILTVYSMYVLHSLIYVHSNLEQFKLNSDLHHYETRNRSNIRVQQLRFTSSQRNLLYMSVKLYNALPMKIKSMPIASFKNKLKSVMLVECLYNVKEFFEIDWTLYL